MRQTKKDWKAWQETYKHARQARHLDESKASRPLTWSAQRPAYACGACGKNKKEVSHA